MLISLAGCVGIKPVDLYCLRDKPLTLSDSDLSTLSQEAAMAVVTHDYNYACRCLENPPAECAQ